MIPGKTADLEPLGQPGHAAPCVGAHVLAQVDGVRAEAGDLLDRVAVGDDEPDRRHELGEPRRSGSGALRARREEPLVDHEQRHDPVAVAPAAARAGWSWTRRSRVKRTTAVRVIAAAPRPVGSPAVAGRRPAIPSSIPAKTQPVQRQQAVPVERGRRARPGRRSRSGGCVEPLLVAVDLELEPRAPGQPHLGAQAQQAVRLVAPRRARSRAPSPTVGVSGSRRPRRRPTPPDEQVEEAAQPPERVAVVPAGARRRSGGSARTPARARPAPSRTRESTSRRAGGRRPSGAARSPTLNASDQRVSASSRSSFTSARAIASR